MPIRKIAPLLLLLFVACKPTKKKESGNVVSIEHFDAFVNSLTVLQMPAPTLYIWDTITAQYMYHDSTVKFRQIHAVRIPAPDNFIAVLYQGYTDKTEMETYILATYTKEGNLIQKTNVYQAKPDPSQNQSLYGKVVMSVDSIIEVRQYYVGDDSQRKKASVIKHLLIQKDGHHSWMKDKKETFQAFAGNFPLLKLPVSFAETPESNGFPQFELNNGWYDPFNFLGFGFPKFYKVGKYNMPGTNYTMYLIKTADIGEEDMEGTIEDGLFLAIFDANGIEAGRMQVTGGEGGEGYYTRWSDFTIDSSGVVRLVEESEDATETSYALGMESVNTRTNKEVQVQANGTFATIATAFNLDLKKFVGDSARKNADTTETANDLYTYLATYPGANIHMVMHSWMYKEEYVYELITVDANRKILDAFTMDSKLSASRPELHGPIKEDMLYLPPFTPMKMTGQVKILLKDDFLSVTSDGKMTKSTADIAAV